MTRSFTWATLKAPLRCSMASQSLRRASTQIACLSSPRSLLASALHRIKKASGSVLSSSTTILVFTMKVALPSQVTPKRFVRTSPGTVSRQSSGWPSSLARSNRAFTTARFRSRSASKSTLLRTNRVTLRLILSRWTLSTKFLSLCGSARMTVSVILLKPRISGTRSVILSSTTR